MTGHASTRSSSHSHFENGRPGEGERATLPVNGACGVASRLNYVQPLTASLGGPSGALSAVEAADASTHRPAADRTAGGAVSSEPGPVQRPGPGSLSTSTETSR
jgi:hypothetical protein